MAQRLYPLQALLSVRHYREDAARNALRLEERRLVQAREEVGRRQAELERYRVWRQEEEERRYAAILGASLSLEEVADFRASLGMLATGEQERFQAVRQAEEQVRQLRLAEERRVEEMMKKEEEERLQKEKAEAEAARKKAEEERMQKQRREFESAEMGVGSARA